MPSHSVHCKECLGVRVIFFLLKIRLFHAVNEPVRVEALGARRCRLSQQVFVIAFAKYHYCGSFLWSRTLQLLAVACLLQCVLKVKHTTQRTLRVSGIHCWQHWAFRVPSFDLSSKQCCQHHKSRLFCYLCNS